METVIMHPKSKEQLSALKAIAKALKVDFETSHSPYNPEFVEKIRRVEKEIREGKVTRLDPNKTIWENIT